MRPLTFGSGSGLGVGPSPEFSFIVFGSPVGAYFKLGGKVQGIRLLASSRHDRAARLGVGHIKVSCWIENVSASTVLMLSCSPSVPRYSQAAGNYAQVFHAQAQARADGYNDVLFLDAEKKMHIEEV